MDTKAKTYRFWKLSGSAAGLLVLLVILVAVNVIVSGMRVRKDLTQEKLYTLTDGTRKVLGKLDRDVTLMFFYTSSAPDVPGPIKQFAQQVEDLLREYERVGGGRVMIEKYDPKPDSEEEDLAQRYGVEGQAISQGGTALYLGIVASCGDVQATLPVVDPRNEELLEYTITRLVHRVAMPKKPTLGVMSSLPVLGSPMPPMMMPGQRPQQQPAWASFRDLQQDYDVRSIPPTAESIDPGVDALMVVHPKDLSDKTLYAIDQFVLRGGHLLAFVDPFCVSDSASVDPMGGYGGMPKRSSDLGRLFGAWGITYDAGKIVADLKATTPLRGRNNAVEYSPLYLSLRKENLNPDDVMTSPVNTLMMVMAGAFGGDGAEGLKITPLITTSEQSALTDAMMAQYDPNAFKRQFKSGQKKLNLAIRVQGKFKTAFPEGKPRESATDTNAVESAGDHLAQSVIDGNVILVADVDMLANDFCVQEMNFLGYSAFQPINDNLSLMANMVDQIAGSSDLMGIRCRGRTFRPFTRVLALEAQAQEQWLEQEQSIEQRLQDTERRMGELQQKKDDKQRFVLSPEQAREIEGFKAEVLKNKQELKQVRRNLREGIESLGMTLKLINIALVPLCVGLAGIVFWLVRRRKTRTT